MTTTYQIAGMLLEIDGDEKYLHKELADFRTVEENGQAAAKVQIFITDELPDAQLTKKRIIHSELIDIYESEEAFYVEYNRPTTVTGYRLDTTADIATIYLYNGADYADVNMMYSIRDAFFYYMQKYDRIVVHSASILYRDRAWLFSACSGTGKSTHVRMWKEAGISVEDFNGDIAACYIDQNGNAVAAGLPWCGTSNIYKNETVPLGGIIFLKRASENKVNSLDEVERIIRIVARCVTPAWKCENVAKNVEIAGKLVQDMFITELYCKPEVAAAVVMRTAIDKYLDEK